MEYNVTAQITEVRPTDDELDDLLDHLIAEGLRGPTVSTAPRLPAGGDIRRLQVIVTVEAPSLRAAVDRAAAALESYGLAEIRGTSTEEFDAETEEIGLGTTMSTTEVAELLGMTRRGVMQMVTRHQLAPAHRHGRVTVFDRREIEALMRRRDARATAS